jgi:N-succinyldiaminopimelate aminotransferase
LITVVNRAHQFITYAVASPLQAAVATALELPPVFYSDLQAMYQAKRDRMLTSLRHAGFEVLKPQGSYFLMADWRGAAPSRIQNDVQFAEWLTSEIGVACIPPSIFYQDSDKHLGRHLARFAVCKKEETLAAAAERLLRLAKVSISSDSFPARFRLDL